MARRHLYGETPLAYLIASHDLALGEVAEAAGLSEQCVRFLARGGHPSKPYPWTANTLARLSKVLGVTPQTLAPELFPATSPAEGVADG